MTTFLYSFSQISCKFLSAKYWWEHSLHPVILTSLLHVHVCVQIFIAVTVTLLHFASSFSCESRINFLILQKWLDLESGKKSLLCSSVLSQLRIQDTCTCSFLNKIHSKPQQLSTYALTLFQYKTRVDGTDVRVGK